MNFETRAAHNVMNAPSHIKQVYFSTYTPMIKVKYADNQTGYDPGAPIEVKVELTIDLDAIVRRLGGKACNNKTGKAIAMGGLVTVKRIPGNDSFKERVKREEEKEERLRLSSLAAKAMVG